MTHKVPVGCFTIPTNGLPPTPRLTDVLHAAFATGMWTPTRIALPLNKNNDEHFDTRCGEVSLSFVSPLHDWKMQNVMIIVFCQRFGPC